MGYGSSEYKNDAFGQGIFSYSYRWFGIDGMTFASKSDEPDGKLYFHVVYDVYGDVTRTDNDYQIILAYGTEGWAQFACPVNQTDIHRADLAAPNARFFVYTGNTVYGVQNLEYERDTERMHMAVYPGKKPVFPNYRMYATDLKAAMQQTCLAGFYDGTESDVVALW